MFVAAPFAAAFFGFVSVMTTVFLLYAVAAAFVVAAAHPALSVVTVLIVAFLLSLVRALNDVPAEMPATEGNEPLPPQP